MKVFQGTTLAIVVLGLVLNVTFQVSSQHLSCDEDEHLPAPPECPPNQGPDDNSTYFPVPYDCHKFFECTNGVAKCLVCAPGTVWSQEDETCVHGDSHECVIVTTTALPTDPPTTTTTTTEPTTTTTTTEPTTTTTPTTTTPTTTTPTTTTPTTTTPTTTTPTTTTTTPTTTTTTPTTTTTTTTTEPTTTTTTTTEVTTTTRNPLLCPEDDDMPAPGECPPWEPYPTYFHYPYNCRKYFQCSNGVAICMQCGNNTVWNQELETCDNEWDYPCIELTTTPRVHAQEKSIISFFKKLFHN